MFKLTASELDCARAAIEYHRYSTLLPPPPEWNDLAEHWPAVRDHLRDLDLELYTPKEPLVITAAKNEMSVRLVHLLHPEDMLLYTSLTLIVKDDIESAREPRVKERVYPYRPSQDDAKLYDSVADTHQRYMDCLKRKATSKGAKTIVVTDIADFYASISQAQLKRLLIEAAQTPRSKAAAELLVSVFARGFMAREGHGIPTGPVASRLLAEIVLNEVDNYLMSKEIDFIRWVDDYNFFAPSLALARAVVRDLASWLYNACGLTLQTAKTHVLNQADYVDRFLIGINDKLPHRADVLAELQDDHGYDSVRSVVEMVSSMDDKLAVGLFEMLVVDAIASEEEVDYRTVGFVARRLRKMALDKPAVDVVTEVLVENIEQLAPIISDVAPLIAALFRGGKMPTRIGSRLLASLRRTGVDHHAAWILTIFAEKGEHAFLNDLTGVYQNAESHVVKRFAALAIAGCGGELKYERQEWEQAPPLVRLALLKFGGVRGHGLRKLDGKLEELIAKGS